MRILFALTYYRPHVSGLTIYVERLARALAARGHKVTVLTSHYSRELPYRELRDGVHIQRAPVAFRVSKGVIMPTIGLQATREVFRHDALSLHLPQLDAAGIALRGRLLGKPTVLTYHSDLKLPPGLVNVAANHVVNVANRVAAAMAHRIVAYTEDFAQHSPYLSSYLQKVEVIPPPVEVHAIDRESLSAFQEKHGGRGPVIGMAARLASEKGVEHLLRAMPRVLERYPQAKVLFAGQYREVLGEAEYAARLQPMIDHIGDHWAFLGVLDPERMAAFYQTCDVTVLPSINNTETFGLVQIESMICGTPVVASNLPGVRQPIRMTGMGRVVPIGDPSALAEGLLEVLDNRQEFLADGQEIADRFSPLATAERYEELFARLFRELGRQPPDG